jgi:DNA polymerase
MARGLRFDSAPDCDVVLTLPNGRELKYPKVKIVSGERGDKIEIYNSVEHRWEHCGAGTLTENVVQAMSRDILAECFLRLEDRGYHTAFHCHDEVVPVVAIAVGPACLEAAIEEMSRVPEWAPRMPLGAEGCLSAHYKK